MGRKKKDVAELTDEQREDQVREAIVTMLNVLPFGEARVPELAIELLETMGDRDDRTKLALLSTTFIVSLKMIAELVELGAQNTPTEGEPTA